MTYEVLARAYRPQRFDEVVGQEHITRTLTRSFDNDRLGHAYIFSGPRGIGKTTTARLLAKLVNCASPDGSEPCNDCESCERISNSQSVDVMEIDGASNNSVDQVRDLRENVQYAPANNNYKVYIIDEVHMLSKSAFNALLKTLEEPPDHVIFIFATTEIENVPDTILSRCQRYDFQLIPTKKLVDSLRSICEQEEIPAEDEALFLIARFAEGSLRDAQSILDQMINFTGAGEETLTGDRVSETWGLAPYDELLTYLKAIEKQHADVAVDRLHEHVSDGKDLTSLIADLAEMVRNLTLLHTEPDSDYLEKSVPEDVLQQLKSLADSFNRTELNWTFEQLIELHEQVRQNSRFQLQLAEVGLIRIIEGRPKYNLSEIVDRLESLESGSPTTSPRPEPTDDSPETSNGSDESNAPSSGSTEDPSPSTATEGTTPAQPEESTESEQQANTSPTDPDRSSPAPGSTREDSGSNDHEETAGGTMDRIVSSTAQPAQAYLRECESLRRDGDKIVVTYDEQWANHAKKLQRDQHLKQLGEAIREVLDADLEPVVKIEDGAQTNEPSTTPTSGNNAGTSNDEDGDRLLEQTKEVFDVDNVEKLDDS